MCVILLFVLVLTMTDTDDSISDDFLKLDSFDDDDDDDDDDSILSGIPLCFLHNHIKFY
jgi:hypothetical protein